MTTHYNKLPIHAWGKVSFRDRFCRPVKFLLNNSFEQDMERPNLTIRPKKPPPSLILKGFNITLSYMRREWFDYHRPIIYPRMDFLDWCNIYLRGSWIITSEVRFSEDENLEYNNGLYI